MHNINWHTILTKKVNAHCTTFINKIINAVGFRLSADCLLWRPYEVSRSHDLQKNNLWHWRQQMCPCLVALLKLKMSALNALFFFCHAKIQFVTLTATKLFWAQGRPPTVLITALETLCLGGQHRCTDIMPLGLLSCHLGIARGPKQPFFMPFGHQKRTQTACFQAIRASEEDQNKNVGCSRLSLHCLLWRQSWVLITAEHTVSVGSNTDIIPFVPLSCHLGI